MIQDRLSFDRTNPGVLVIDDNFMNITAIQGVLSLFNVHSEKAISGQDALNIIESRTMSYLTENTPMFVLIFLDFSMPDMDGPEVFSKIRQSLKDTGLEMPYVCCCSAYTE